MRKSRAELLTPYRIRSVEIKNRVVISPMCQYSAEQGFVKDWHLVQLGRYAMGGAGMVFVEATAVEAEGRITHGDLGLWSDDQIPGLKRLAGFLKSLGAIPAIQLSHAGRKASSQRPWHGGRQLAEDDMRARGELRWETVSSSDLLVYDGAPRPRRLSLEDLTRIKEAWISAALRALEAGFEVIELHCAHGYLLHQFLSPLCNTRTDQYGGSLEARCRFPLEVARALRDVWPEDKPMFARISAVDGLQGGITIDDSLYLARALKKLGVDLIDCSSGGIGGSATAAGLSRDFGFQVPFAEAIRQQVAIPTMAVGLIVMAEQAETIIRNGQADLVAIAREAMFNPNWALHAEQALSGELVFDHWPEQAGWWLANRQQTLERLEQQPGVD